MTEPNEHQPAAELRTEPRKTDSTVGVVPLPGSTDVAGGGAFTSNDGKVVAVVLTEVKVSEMIKATPERRFKVIDAKEWGVPNTIPWSLVEPLRQSALKGHNQTLERLDERGGLSVIELYVHVHQIPWSNIFAWNKKKAEVLAWFQTWTSASITEVRRDG